jgi:hypothetical protein
VWKELRLGVEGIGSGFVLGGRFGGEWGEMEGREAVTMEVRETEVKQQEMEGFSKQQQEAIPSRIVQDREGGDDVVPPPTNPMVSALLTDMYQITMAYAYWKAGKHRDLAV